MPPFDPGALENWDPGFIARYLPAILWMRDRYYRATVTGLEHLPDGPFLLVGVHGGGMVSPDALITGASFYEATRLERPLYSLAHRAHFSIPGFRRALAKGGAILATRENASRVLRAGHALAVFPGGDLDMARTWRRRNVVDFAGRTGFARTALEEGVPIVPVGSAGGHETWVVLTDGARLCRALGLDRLFRMRVFPLALALPFGVTSAYTPYLPFPAKVDVSFGAPMRFTPSAAERAHPGYHAHVRDLVQAAVQRLVDDLLRARRS